MLHRLMPVLFITLAFVAPGHAQPQPPIGVPECDIFLNGYERCIANNVPPAQRSRVAAEARQVREETREAAQDPQQRAALAQNCAQMQQMMSQWMQERNCRF